MADVCDIIMRFAANLPVYSVKYKTNEENPCLKDFFYIMLMADVLVWL